MTVNLSKNLLTTNTYNYKIRFMKVRFILALLFLNLLFAVYLMISGQQGSAIANENTDNTVQEPQTQNAIAQNATVTKESPQKVVVKKNENICYSLITDNITEQLKLLNGFEQSKIKEEKKYNIYWGLGQNKEEAVKRYTTLQTKGLFDDKNIDLIYIGQQYSILVGNAPDDKQALQQVREMSNKTTSFGGKWFYGSYTVVSYKVNFSTDNKNLVNQLSKTYTLTKCA